MFQKVKIKDIKLQLGQLTKFMRKKEKLSQEQLADLLGLSRITVQNLESGKNFTIDTLLKVARHFDLLDEISRSLQAFQEEQEEVKSLY